MALTLLVVSAGSFAIAAGPTTVSLGTADQFAVLAGSGITHTGLTTITGDIGSHPTTTMTGTASIVLIGTNHGGDAVTQGAKDALVTAYDNAAGKTPTTTVPTELGGTILPGGSYTAASGTFGITGSLTLDGQNDPSSVWVFKMASSLTTASSSRVILTNGAQACNVFWQVGSSATLGGSTRFVGNILALTSITLVTGATIDGRALARNGAVTLDTNTITRSTCSAATPVPATATPIATIAPTATPIATIAPTATPIATVAPTATPIATVPASPVVVPGPVARTPGPVVAPIAPPTGSVAVPVAAVPPLVAPAPPTGSVNVPVAPVLTTITRLPATSTSSEPAGRLY